MALLAAIHGGVRWFAMTWYFAPAGAIWAIFLGLSTHRLIQAAPEPRRKVQMLTAIIIALLPVASLAAEPPKLGDNNASFVFRKFTAIADETLRLRGVPDTARIGAFNSGVIAFYSVHPCANLDGVVSYGAFRAIEGRALDKYIRENDIKFIIDRNIDFNRYEAAAGLSLDRKRLELILEMPVAERRDHWTKEKRELALAIYEVKP
jgi:hypothetical protein